MTGWALFWACWLGAVAASFAAAETVAIIKGETLSEVIRRWLGVDPRKSRRAVAVPLFVAAVAGFAAWFIPHIIN